MYWPTFDAATFGNMVVSTLIGLIAGLISGWILANRSNQMAKEQQQREWEYAHLLRMRDESVEELNYLERNPPIGELVTFTDSTTPPVDEFFVRRLTEHNQKIESLRNRIEGFDFEIEKLRKG